MKQLIILISLSLLIFSLSVYADDFTDATVELAEQGDTFAQYLLGDMYYWGEGVLQDDKQAVHWYTKAAAQGHADAQYLLGDMYHRGKGVPEDDKQAVHWYTKAAAQGHASAQYLLGENNV